MHNWIKLLLGIRPTEFCTYVIVTPHINATNYKLQEMEILTGFGMSTFRRNGPVFFVIYVVNSRYTT